MSHTPNGAPGSRGMKPIHAGILLAVAALATGFAASLAEGTGHAAGETAVKAAAVSGSEEAARLSLWKAVASSGRVESLPDGSPPETWSRVHRGDRLPGLTRVRTQKRSRTTLVRGGDVILMDPESRISLPAALAGSAALIRQESGRALYEVEPVPGRSLAVETPLLVAGVKGTVFSVIVDEAFSSVSVVNGVVAVRSRATGRTVELRDGETAVFDGRSGAMEVHGEARREAREMDGERELRLRSATRATKDLLSEASASLLDDSFENEGWRELRSLDLSAWKSDRNLMDDDLTSTLEEEKSLLRNEEDQKAINLGIKSR